MNSLKRLQVAPHTQAYESEPVPEMFDSSIRLVVEHHSLPSPAAASFLEHDPSSVVRVTESYPRDLLIWDLFSDLGIPLLGPPYHLSDPVQV